MGRGDLVIVGGAEILHRAPIFSRFVELAGGGIGRFAILASATRKPISEFEKLRRWLAEAGADPTRVEMLEVSQFIPGMEKGAWNAAEQERLARADGLWMLGGDQNLTTSLLREADGRDTPLLAAIRQRAAKPRIEGGLVLGGTSAGAAIMSDPMIGGGTSFGALALPRASGAASVEMSRALYVLPGFGFFAEGMIDQHFDTRARFARLLEASLVEDGARRLAFGIDEATALVQEGAASRISVVGAGGISIIDPRQAKRSMVQTAAGARVQIEGVLFHYLSSGDGFFPSTESFDFGGKELIQVDDAAFASDFPEASGILSPYGTFAQFAARMLLDNDPELLFKDILRGRRYARSLLVEEVPSAQGGKVPLAWEIRVGRASGLSGGIMPKSLALSQGERSEGERLGNREARLYYDGRFSFENVYVDILPIGIEIRR